MTASDSEEMTRSAIHIQASFRGRRVRAADIRAQAKERGKALAQEKRSTQDGHTDFDAKLAAFHGTALNSTVTHRIDFANAANDNSRRQAAKPASDAGNRSDGADSLTKATHKPNSLRRPRATTRFGADATPAPTATAASATAASKLLRAAETRPLQTSQEGTDVPTRASTSPAGGHTVIRADGAAVATAAATKGAAGAAAAAAAEAATAAARATQEELRRNYASEHAILVSEHESRMAMLAEVEATVAKQRELASERDAERWRHTEELAQAMTAEREKLETDRAQMIEQLAKLEEQSRRELMAWGDAQAADKGRLDALATQLEGLRNERAALSAEREAMAHERKKLEKIRKQQQEAARHEAEDKEKVPVSVVQKRMQRQWAAQRQAYERLERLIYDAKGKPTRRASAAAAKGGLVAGVKTDASVAAAHPRRRRRRRKRHGHKNVGGASTTAAAAGGVPAGEQLRWRTVPLRMQVPPSMLFSPAALSLQQGSSNRGRDNASFSHRPKSGHADLERGTSANALGEPEDFALRCARRAAVIEARLTGYDAATF